MTREEAIRYLEQHKYPNTCGQKSLSESNEAIDMAIEALKDRPHGDPGIKVTEDTISYVGKKYKEK